MIVVDTSIWIDVLRDRSGQIVELFLQTIGNDLYVLTRFTQLELLQGAKDDYEWKRLKEYLITQFYLEAPESTWVEAARIYYDLRRKGIKVNSPIDCCIAQIAIENNAGLLHNDQDFEKIQQVRPLDAIRFSPKENF